MLRHATAAVATALTLVAVPAGAGAETRQVATAAAVQAAAAKVAPLTPAAIASRAEAPGATAAAQSTPAAAADGSQDSDVSAGPIDDEPVPATVAPASVALPDSGDTASGGSIGACRSDGGTGGATVGSGRAVADAIGTVDIGSSEPAMTFANAANAPIRALSPDSGAKSPGGDGEASTSTGGTGGATGGGDDLGVGDAIGTVGLGRLALGEPAEPVPTRPDDGGVEVPPVEPVPTGPDDGGVEVAPVEPVPTEPDDGGVGLGEPAEPVRTDPDDGGVGLGEPAEPVPTEPHDGGVGLPRSAEPVPTEPDDGGVVRPRPADPGTGDADAYYLPVSGDRAGGTPAGGGSRAVTATAGSVAAETLPFTGFGPGVLLLLGALSLTFGLVGRRLAVR